MALLELPLRGVSILIHKGFLATFFDCKTFVKQLQWVKTLPRQVSVNAQFNSTTAPKFPAPNTCVTSVKMQNTRSDKFFHLCKFVEVHD
ncbi:hypothetical protein [Limnohabitans sp.]|uniref:hypothetical protein n=1 Tax=Limnohabitans sp. TaxID=1907725 RepID=UPI0025BC7D03|nr:hypothetical protein [Limnohabitans sp.]